MKTLLIALSIILIGFGYFVAETRTSLDELRAQIASKTIEVKVQVDIEESLLDKLAEEVSYRERTEMENEALKDYIKGFEDKFWKGEGE